MPALYVRLVPLRLEPDKDNIDLPRYSGGSNKLYDIILLTRNGGCSQEWENKLELHSDVCLFIVC